MIIIRSLLVFFGASSQNVPPLQPPEPPPGNYLTWRGQRLTWRGHPLTWK